jgi:hypothetical protein
VTDSVRNWGKEELINAHDVSVHPRIPLARGENTWRNWLRDGVRINGVVRMIPSIMLQGRRLTSIEAVLEVFDIAPADSWPIERMSDK